MLNPAELACWAHRLNTKEPGENRIVFQKILKERFSEPLTFLMQLGPCLIKFDFLQVNNGI